jgi:prolyl oligopeptidase
MGSFATRVAPVLLAFWALGAATVPEPQIPIAAVRPVTEDYFGTKVTDSYRWMEDRRGPEFLAWAKAENEYTRTKLAAIPHRDQLLQRIEELDSSGTLVVSVQRSPHNIVYLKRGPSDNIFKLYVRQGSAGAERVLLNPDRDAAAGTHNSIDYFRLSPDGRYVAVGVSAGGSEESVIRVIDATTGSTMPERIDRTEYGNPAWRADGRSFFYNRFAAVAADAPETAKFLNSRLYLHRVGQSADHDELILAAGENADIPMTPVDYPFIVTAAGSSYAVALILHGSAPEVSLYITSQAKMNGTRTPWRKLADVGDAVTSVALHGDDVYVLSHKGASRYQILLLKSGAADAAHATVVVPESKVVIEEFGVAADGLYFRILDAGVQRLRRLDFATKGVTDLDPSAAGGIGEFATATDLPGVLFSVQSWIAPPRWFEADATNARARDIGWVPPWRVDTSAYQISELSAVAKDGTMVPLSLIHARQLARDGTHPVLLRGYGAYGLSLTPTFAPGLVALLERGGVVAVAHVRGGGELGESWHEAGKQGTKPNSHRDLIACAEYLISQNYTTASKLAIHGGSAGGITVGMAMTERPELFRVVLSDVGDSNALRAEQETDGDANALEYGSVKNEAGFRALLAVDAVQHVTDGTAYPAVLLTTGINDPRVAPWQPGKMAARLQAATTGGRPVLLRVDYDAGHGFGSTRKQRDELLADQLAFMFWQVGLPDFQPARAPPASQ